MRKFILFAFAITLFSVKTAFNQQLYRLHISQPPPITITLAESINAPVGTVVNLDTLFHVQGDITYQREWKFRDEEQWETIDNPILTLNKKGVFYLTITDRNGCKTNDSVAYDVATGIGNNYTYPNQPSIQVYPNPNTGTFDINISECLPGFSLQLINSIGVQLLNQTLNCNKNEYATSITIPGGHPGIYYLIVKNNNTLIYSQKVILLAK
jgi:hypothetical protein